MADELMITVRVRPGAVLAHEGREYVAGEELTLPARIARELPHLFDEVVGSGIRPIGATASSLDKIAEELAGSRSHERLSILEWHRAKLAADLADVERQMAAVRAAAASAEAPKAPEPAKVAQAPKAAPKAPEPAADAPKA